MDICANGYTLDGLRGRVERAMEIHADYIREMEYKFVERSSHRARNGYPTLCLLGMGRAGKDTAAEYIGEHSPLVYAGSSSNRLCKFVATAVGVTEEEAFRDRHAHRDVWKAVGNIIRGEDMTILVRVALARGDMAVGLRGAEEPAMARAQGIIDLNVWIDNPRVPDDHTVEFGRGACDTVVRNDGTLEEFHANLRAALPRVPWSD